MFYRRTRRHEKSRSRWTRVLVSYVAVESDENLPMPKMKTGEIKLSDLNAYLKESHTDFEFELSVLRELRSQHLKCEHGGHYEDPVTKKPREFDIRALFVSGTCRVRLAIECKNIGHHYPLLVSLVPRQLDEAYHEFAHVLDPPNDHRARLRARARSCVVPNSRLYPPNEGVVKNITQVGRQWDSATAFTASDSEVYDKWGQALASATDLVAGTAEDHWDIRDGDMSIFSAVVPLLVVPNGRLWGVSYDVNGTQLGDPIQLNRASSYVGKSYTLNVEPPTNLILSHLEIVTFDGLFDFINKFLRSDESMFPMAAVKRAMARPWI